MDVTVNDSIIIEKDRETVFNEIINQDGFKNWRINLQSSEIIKGNSGEINSKVKSIYESKESGQEIITETIVKKDFPNELKILFEGNDVHMISTYKFEELNGNKTKIQISNLNKALSFFAGVVFSFNKDAVRKGSRPTIENFKNYIE